MESHTHAHHFVYHSKFPTVHILPVRRLANVYLYKKRWRTRKSWLLLFAQVEHFHLMVACGVRTRLSRPLQILVSLNQRWIKLEKFKWNGRQWLTVTTSQCGGTHTTLSNVHPLGKMCARVWVCRQRQPVAIIHSFRPYDWLLCAPYIIRCVTFTAY